MSDSAAPVVHFGGPDRPPRHLRDLLQSRIEAVPPGGEIVWSTYYFRDRALAHALVQARTRGVRVRLHLEGHPRRASVNRQVIEILSKGLGPGLHLHRPHLSMLRKLHGHLHSKIYCFSHPQPTVLVGSFNPSGDVPEDFDVIGEIGDQDRGHNLLVESRDPVLVEGLRAAVQRMGRVGLRLWPDQNRRVSGRHADAWTYPRLCTGVIDAHLERVASGGAIIGAISHMKSGFLTAGLMRAARRGVSVRLLVHDTERRVPAKTIAALDEAGISVARYVHPEQLPLHAKFLLVDEASSAHEERTAYFGSFNYNPKSRYLNREILLASRHPAIWSALMGRFNEISAEGFGT